MPFFRRALVLTLLATVVAAGSPRVAAHEPPKRGRLQRTATLDLALQEAIAKGAPRVRVIIRVEPAVREKVKSALRQRPAHVLLREHPVISALTMEVPVRALQGILRQAGVVSLSIDGPVGIDSVAASEETAISGTLLRATLGLRSQTLDGAGIGVAVIDSGIQPSLDFASRIRAFYDFTTDDTEDDDSLSAPYDDHGHGTHVAGLIGGSGTLSDGLYVGIAPRVSLIALKVLRADGRGYTSDVISAIEFATTYKASLGIDIINLSLGHPPYESADTDPLVLAVEHASAAGIVVLTSAGNGGVNPATGLPGYGGVTSPGNARSAITVGSGHTRATIRRTDDLVEPYSSRGPTRFDYRAKPDVIAPGHKLIAPAALGSTLAVTYPSWLVSSATFSARRYMRLTGTSMAAAVTSGVVALMLQAQRDAAPLGTVRPRLTPNAIKAILQFTAQPMRLESQHVVEIQ